MPNKNRSRVLLIKSLGKDSGLLSPRYPTDCGYDLKSSVDIILPPGQQYPIDIPSGVCVKLPSGTWGLIVGRSSTIRKMGIEVQLGVIDENFTGELLACCYNRTNAPVKVERDMRLAQLILMKRVPVELSSVDELPETDRGKKGFGSTN